MVCFRVQTRGSIRPIELGRRLVREMDDKRSVDVKGRRIVPNNFEFHLSPKDHAGFAEIEEVLAIELGEAAREHAREEGYHFMGPVPCAHGQQHPQSGPVRNRVRHAGVRPRRWCRHTDHALG